VYDHQARRRLIERGQCALEGCGGGYDYDYGYESCMITHSIERDVFIDLARGEVVLDIVRTGPPSSPLGFVRFADNEVHVDACGVSQTLALTHTS
jgi:hypothetical protein